MLNKQLHILFCYSHSQFHCIPENTTQKRKSFGHERVKKHKKQQQKNNITKFARE